MSAHFTPYSESSESINSFYQYHLEYVLGNRNYLLRRIALDSNLLLIHMEDASRQLLNSNTKISAFARDALPYL